MTVEVGQTYVEPVIAPLMKRTVTSPHKLLSKMIWILTHQGFTPWFTQ